MAAQGVGGVSAPSSPWGLAEELRKPVKGLWEKLPRHPFVQALYSGELPLEKFKYYVIQDYNYLVGLTRALAAAAAKAASLKVAASALEIARTLATTEMEGYEELLRELGLSIDEAVAAEPAPTNRAYTDFMLATCMAGSVSECLAGLLPCYWSYQYIADANRSLLEKNRIEMYRRWAEVYYSPGYRRAVEALVEAMYEAWRLDGTPLQRLQEAFKTAARYEYLFWEMAWRGEAWPS